jgi:hypothetical protein
VLLREFRCCSTERRGNRSTVLEVVREGVEEDFESLVQCRSSGNSGTGFVELRLPAQANKAAPLNVRDGGGGVARDAINRAAAKAKAWHQSAS